MYPCLSEVRVHLQQMAQRLLHDMPGVRLGMVAHGDYGDRGGEGQMDKCYRQLDFTTSADELAAFAAHTPAASGFDFAECYELVLHNAQKLTWRAAKMRALVMIGDACPHEPDDIRRHFPKEAVLDWRHEARELKAMGVNIYSVQCLDGGPLAHTFFKHIADVTSGYHLRLHQFAHLHQMLTAIALHQAENSLGSAHPMTQRYEQELVKSLGGMTDNMRAMFDALLGRESKAPVASGSSGLPSGTFGSPAGGIKPCAPTRFQVLTVDQDGDIKAFVQRRGLVFAKGRGFYEFTKKETIQANKEVVLMDRVSGALYEGDGARQLLKLPSKGKVNLQPDATNTKYRVFVQSTSYNRKLLRGTGFLYEVPV